MTSSFFFFLFSTWVWPWCGRIRKRSPHDFEEDLQDRFAQGSPAYAGVMWSALKLNSG